MSRTNEADSPASATPDVIREIWIERVRQVEVEGYTPDLDAGYVGGELALAGAAYALRAAHDAAPETTCFTVAARSWPFGIETFKPRTERENLVRAGALIVAAIERLDAAEAC